MSMRSTFEYKECLLMVVTPSKSDSDATVYMHIDNVRSKVLDHARVSNGLWVELYEYSGRGFAAGRPEGIAEYLTTNDTPDLESVIEQTREEGF